MLPYGTKNPRRTLRAAKTLRDDNQSEIAVIPESRSRESVVRRGCFLAKLRDSRLRHSGMTATATTVPRTLRAAKPSGTKTPSGGQKAQQGLGLFYPLRRAL